MAKIEISPKGYFQSINEFKLLHDIGVGSFGKVKLALHTGTRRTYAIKIIDLTANLTSSEASLVAREIKMHSKLDHPHIIKLWDTLTDGHKIYMVMDYAQNGSLFNYHSALLKEGKQPSIAQIYQFFYQTLQAVKYLHSLDIMHRDIKPENLLLDQNLNVKLCDFGWATNQITTPRFTFCGTYEYMAPEMALEKSYNFNIDIWALGILLFELVHGRAPFQADSLKVMKERITIGSYQINSQCGDELKNLIIDILQFVPEKRLSIKQIQSHEWVLINQSISPEDIISQTDNQSIKLLRKDLSYASSKNNKSSHQHFQSIDNFLRPPILSYEASSNPLVNKTKIPSKMSVNQLEEFKQHKRNMTQPIEAEQCRSFDKKMEVLFDFLQTEANTPLPLQADHLQKTQLKLRKQTKKCKTQGEDEISDLLTKVKSSKRGQYESEQIFREKKSHLRTETGQIIPDKKILHSRHMSNGLLKENFMFEQEFKQEIKKKREVGEKTRNKIQRIEDKLLEISSKLSPVKAKTKFKAN